MRTTFFLLLALVTAFSAAELGVPDVSSSRFRKHGLAEAPAKPADVIRLATYNIHDLYDHSDDPALTGRADDLGRAMPENRQVATAEVLSRIDADIVALQEVESLEALLWYRDTHLADMGYTHAVSLDVGHAIGLEQAVLSRFPIIESRVWPEMHIGVHPPEYRARPNRFAGQPLLFRRSPLMVEVDLAGGAAPPEAEADRLTLLVVHFKTGRNSQHWRLAEAEGIAKIIAEMLTARPDRRIVVLGDFAVEPSEGHLRPLFDAGFVDAFSHTDPTPPTPPTPDELATDIEGRRDCLILLGPNLAQSAASPGSGPGGRFVLGTVVPPGQLERNIAFGMPGFASDHYPLVIDLPRPAE